MVFWNICCRGQAPWIGNSNGLVQIIYFLMSHSLTMMFGHLQQLFFQPSW